MDVAHEVQRFSELLRLRIVASGLTQRAVERKLGWSTGYVSQLLRGNQDLKLKQVYAILGAIGVSPDELAADIMRARSPQRVGEVAAALHSSPSWGGEMQLRELLDQLRPMIRQMVQEELGQESVS